MGAGVGAVVVGAEVVGAEAVAAAWQWMSVRESLNESPASFLSTFACLKRRLWGCCGGCCGGVVEVFVGGFVGVSVVVFWLFVVGIRVGHNGVCDCNL